MLLALTALPAVASHGDTLFVETFDDQEAFNKWTTIDCNGGRTWEWLNGHAAYMLDYQTGLPGDDYLVSPGITLKGGMVYDLNFSLTMSNNVNLESCRVYLGSAPDTAHLTTVLGEWRDVTNEVSGMKQCKIVADTTGTYYIAFYSFSQANQNRFEIDDVSVVERSTVSVPGMPTSLNVSAATKGQLSATVGFHLPTLLAGNKAIASDASLSYAIYRDSLATPVKTGNGLPGDSINYVDGVKTNGFHTYSVIVSNTEGNGRAASTTAYIGNDTPVTPTGLAAHVGTDYAAHLSWNSPKSSVHGGYVDAAQLRYNVLRNDSVVAVTTDTTYLDKVPVARGQQRVVYTVQALFDNLQSAASSPAECLAGEPLKAPYVETFANGKAATPWIQDATTHDFDWEVSEEVTDDWSGETFTAPDHDGGYLVASTSYASGGESRFISPMIDINKLSNPELSFYFYYNRSQWYDPEMEGEINDRVQVQVSYDGGDWTDVSDGALRINDHTSQWQRVAVQLPKQTAKFVQIGLLAVSDNDGENCGDLYVDSVAVDESALQTDLAVTALTARQLRVTANDSLCLTASIRNRGAQAASGYQVTFLRNGEAFASVNGPVINSAATATVTLNVPTTVEDAKTDSICWQAVATLQGDELAANDSSDVLLTSVRVNDYPAPELTGAASGNSVILHWNALSSQEATTAEKKTVTDDFESYEPFTIDRFGDWTTYDGDKATTLMSPRIPVRYDHEGEPMAWQVFNNVKSGTYVEGNYDDPFQAHSGVQYLMSASCDWPAENDDWLITPRLDGSAQTITFWAKGATYDSEWMDVYYSTTDNHHDSFEKLNASTIYVHDNWEKYSYDVPQGARYFALRNARRTMFLFVDDFTYNAYNGAKEQLDLIGYNVYRDGVRLNDTPFTSAGYTDDGVATGSNHTYAVTAVYKQGESNYSNEFSTVSTGINTMDSNAKTASVYNLSGMRLPKAQRGLNIIREANGKVKKVIRK